MEYIITAISIIVLMLTRMKLAFEYYKNHFLNILQDLTLL